MVSDFENEIECFGVVWVMMIVVGVIANMKEFGKMMKKEMKAPFSVFL
jgi:hypothetical protein